MKKKSLKVKVAEDIASAEKLHNNKPWFNGMKRFISIKLSPPKK